MSETRATVALALVVLAVTSTFAGTAAAVPETTLEVRPGADGTATYVTTVEVTEANAGSLSTFALGLGAAGIPVNDTSSDAVRKAGIDRGGDDEGTTIDVSVREDVQGVTVWEGDRLEVVFDGTTELEPGDELVVVLGGVTAPKPGTYDVPITVNEPVEESLQSVSVSIDDPTDAASSPTPTPAAAVTGGSDSATASSPESAQTADPMGVTDSPVPGFGAVPAVVALAAATVAMRAWHRRR